VPVAAGSSARPTPDRVIARSLRLVLLSAILSLFPFTIYSTFLVPIAAAAGTGEAAAGTMRGLGGVAALAVGIGVAPLLARWPRPQTFAAGLLALAAASGVATFATPPALIVFCFGIGAATAVLTPVLLSAATAAFTDPEDAGRAATIVTATQSLAAVLAGPVIGAMAWWNGWHGAMWITAALAATLAVIVLATSRGRPAVDATAGDGDAGRGSAPATATRQPIGYRAAFRSIRSRPGLVALIVIAALRTTSFMGALAFLAIAYHDRFGLDAGTFTLVWTLSGGSFFAGNFLAGRWARRTAADARLARALLWAGLAAGTVGVVIVFTAPALPVALAATAVTGFGHAVVAAQVTTSIARRAGELAPVAFSLNGAGMSLGVFAGAAIGGVGLAIAGETGIAVVLALPTLAAGAIVPWAVGDDRSDR
jgi:predicted MFS family arabinose efflux permease